jgi:hypothetical protein
VDKNCWALTAGAAGVRGVPINMGDAKPLEEGAANTKVEDEDDAAAADDDDDDIDGDAAANALANWMGSPPKPPDEEGVGKRGDAENMGSAAAEAAGGLGETKRAALALERRAAAACIWRVARTRSLIMVFEDRRLIICAEVKRDTSTSSMLRLRGRSRDASHHVAAAATHICCPGNILALRCAELLGKMSATTQPVQPSPI